MNTKMKIFLGVFVLLSLLSVSASYYRFMVLHDYVIEAEVDCDSSVESCFVWECDPSVEGECTGDPEYDTWYYKIVSRNAQYIPECMPDDTDCDQFSCSPQTEEDCSYVYCSPDTLAEYGLEGTCAEGGLAIEAQENIPDEIFTPEQSFEETGNSSNSD